jgi:hypothetical protein
VWGHRAIPHLKGGVGRRGDNEWWGWLGAVTSHRLWVPAATGEVAGVRHGSSGMENGCAAVLTNDWRGGGALTKSGEGQRQPALET